jgi:AraC-like DNA-binding protein
MHAVNTPPLSSPSDDRRSIQRAREYLHEHFNQNVSLACLAELTGLNPFQLLRLFRRHVGVPPHEYLLQIRVNRAKKLLLEGQTPVDAALVTGFFDQSHFCRHFHRLVGVTPSEYRNAHRTS